MTDTNHPTHLSPSELGTKDYWDTFYARTLAHLSQKQTPTDANEAHQTQVEADGEEEEDDQEDVDDDSDPGTSWFSEYNAPDKVLRFLTGEEFPLAPVNTRTSGTTEGEGKREQPSILDLGTGNGSMLALLRKRGHFRGEMVGVDYSRASVELARRLQVLRAHEAYLSDSEDEGEDGVEEEEGKEIRFEEWDILRAEGWALADADNGGGRSRVDWFPYSRGGFDIVLDKGTFDAVSLSEEVVEDAERKDGSGKTIQRRVCETYPGIARRTVRKGGFLVVTSCNWTEEELVQWFTRETGEEEDRLVVWGRVEYPTFRFGGREGQGVVTVCFQRV
ncbi:putative S-adenosylmethionine-dependent methyltransferase [Aspergillus candidus]|uniref:Protein-lysine N-methyltransferase EFM4 n=1 Tax=Aspergillus candidus TaxID=41067 RepID=A0A2I2EXV9_ASPCN|nr:methyltransferase domain-domain-containing protein [Aspergillus candidus]PLB33208.1 methyltransferase domain-domain-containing protein [Aspergillus candidus]